MMTDTEPQTDSLILPYLRATDAKEARRILEEIVVQQADPIIKGVFARQTRTGAGRRASAGRPEETEAVQGETVVRLVTRLEALREEGGAGTEAPIADLRGYVAGLALEHCQSWLRRLFPRRAMLRNRLRYLLGHDPRFLFRPSPGEGWLCGLADRDVRSMRNGGGPEASFDAPALPDAPSAAVAAGTPSIHGDPSPAHLAGLARDLLARAGRPLDLDFLVDAVARLCGLDEVPERGPAAAEKGRAVRQAAVAVPESASAAPDAARAAPDAARDPAGLLRKIWEEIQLLPPLQRSVLLLNLRDTRGRGLIGLFPVTGVAGIRRIAIALGVRPERFAELWRELPLDDAAIAGRLRMSRSQVSDLRQAALRRLARRMGRD
jgi:hypothetical protein